MKKIFWIFGTWGLIICLGCTACSTAAEKQRSDGTNDPEASAEESTLQEKYSQEALSENDSSEQKTETESSEAGAKAYAGTYVAELSLQDYISAERLNTLENANLTSVADLMIPLTLVLGEDGKCFIKVDEDLYKNSMREALMKDADCYLTEAFAQDGVKPEKFDKVAKNAGYGGYENLKKAFADDYNEEFVKDFEQDVSKLREEGSYVAAQDTVLVNFSGELIREVIQVDDGFEVLFELNGKIFKTDFCR